MFDDEYEIRKSANIEFASIYAWLERQLVKLPPVGAQSFINIRGMWCRSTHTAAMWFTLQFSSEDLEHAGELEAHSYVLNGNRDIDSARRSWVDAVLAGRQYQLRRLYLSEVVPVLRSDADWAKHVLRSMDYVRQFKPMAYPDSLEQHYKSWLKPMTCDQLVRRLSDDAPPDLKMNWASRRRRYRLRRDDDDRSPSPLCGHPPETR